MQNGTNTSLGPNMTSFSFNSRKFFFFFSRGGHFVCLPVPVCVCVWLADWLFLSLSLCLCLCMHWFSTTFIHLSPVISLCCLYQSFCCSVWTANAKKCIVVFHRSTNISALSAGQLAVLRKYSLLKLTALIERYTHSHRGMWHW